MILGQKCKKCDGFVGEVRANYDDEEPTMCNCNNKAEDKKMRQWGNATRDLSDDKLDFEGCLSPLVLEAFAKYMKKHEETANGRRQSDNWQGFFGNDHYSVCLKSLMRHTHDLWMFHRGYKGRETIDNALNGILFNCMAFYLKYLTEKKD